MRGGEAGDAAGASLSSSPQTHTISLLILTLQAELSDTAGSCLMRKENVKEKTQKRPGTTPPTSGPETTSSAATEE